MKWDLDFHRCSSPRRVLYICPFSIRIPELLVNEVPVGFSDIGWVEIWRRDDINKILETAFRFLYSTIPKPLPKQEGALIGIRAKHWLSRWGAAGRYHRDIAGGTGIVCVSQVG
jgi:hypothetical protein